MPDAQAIFCRRRHQPRRPPQAKIKPGLGQRDYGAQKQKRAGPSEVKASTLVSSSAIKGRRPSDDELTTASRQGEKSTASEDQTGQSSADYGTWNAIGRNIGHYEIEVVVVGDI